MTVTTETRLAVGVSQFLAEARKMLIGGQWVDAASSKTFDLYDPATGEVVARAAEGDKADIDRAVKAVRAAFWRIQTVGLGS